MKTRIQLLALGTMLAISIPAAAQSSDPVFGTWQLNVAKSTYSPGPAPKSSTRTYVAVKNGYKFSSKGIDAEGKAVATEFTAYYDGKYHPMTGSTTVDSIMVVRVDANNSSSTQTKAGKVMLHTTRVVSKDGKTLTATATGTNAAGKAFRNVELFDKR